jgi:hypothetical protein
LNSTELFQNVLLNIDELLLKDDIPNHMKNNIKYVKKEIEISFKNYLDYKQV